MEAPPPRERRLKRREAIPPRKMQKELAMDAAKEYLLRPGQGIREVARKFGVNYPSHVSYWLRKWQGSLVVDAFAEMEKEPEAPPSSSTAIAIASDHAAGPSRGVGSSSKLMPRHKLYRTMMDEAVALKKKGQSLRQAAASINNKYEGNIHNLTISHASVKNYLVDHYKPGKAGGRTKYLPENFNEKICDFIVALRALKFPVTKDQVIACANRVLEQTHYLEKFKDRQLGGNWYFNSFLREFHHRLGTGAATPLEMARARWATAANVAQWYDILAKVLVESKVAVWNPDYSAEAPAGTDDAEPIFVTKPERSYFS